METPELPPSPPKGRWLFIINSIAVAALGISLAASVATSIGISADRRDRCERITETLDLIGEMLEVSADTKDAFIDEFKTAFEVTEENASIQRLRVIVNGERDKIDTLLNQALPGIEC